MSELTFTVFDTETTGLDPANGDEIIQIAAVRIVNGKLLRNENFDQLVDPKRKIPAITIPIHGIKPEMVRGQPTIDKVLPAFHTFVSRYGAGGAQCRVRYALFAGEGKSDGDCV